MNPNPLSSLNHFTVPVAILASPSFEVLRTRELLVSKGYERGHCDAGRNRPTLCTEGSSTGIRLGGRSAPLAE
jgi:hypothetical protein